MPVRSRAVVRRQRLAMVVIDGWRSLEEALHVIDDARRCFAER